MPTYADLRRTSPDYQAPYWANLRAFYQGGQALLGNPDVMARVFPANPNEDPATYAARRARAVYVNYAGAIVDYIVASLGTDPLSMSSSPSAPPFFDEFQRDTDRRGMSLAGLLRQQILTALITRRAWTLVDLPPLDDGAVIESELDEANAGMQRAMAFPVDPECVLDWDADPSGSMSFALMCQTSRARDGVSGDRSTVVEHYTYFTRDTWERYDVIYKIGRPPKPRDAVPLAKSGAHSFGAVPLIPLELPYGLWALDKLANLAQEHFNRRSSTSWAMYRHLFPILVAKLGPEDTQSESAGDPSRASSQVYGIGRMIQLGSNDNLGYVSPDSSVFTTGLQDLAGLRDEMYRVVHQMAMAADNSAAALGRSGSSKAQDKAASGVVLGELGRMAREHAVAVLTAATAGRKDPPTVWSAHGMETFELADASAVAEEAEIVQGLQLKSPTFRGLYGYRVAKTLLQGSATPDDLAKIQSELEDDAAQPVDDGALPAMPAASKPPAVAAKPAAPVNPAPLPHTALVTPFRGITMRSPAMMLPVHGVRDQDKVARIAESMRNGGWQGRPLLAERLPPGGPAPFRAWTGSHRFAAAIMADLAEVPVVLVDGERLLAGGYKRAPEKLEDGSVVITFRGSIAPDAGSSSGPTSATTTSMGGGTSGRKPTLLRALEAVGDLEAAAVMRAEITLNDIDPDAKAPGDPAAGGVDRGS